MNPTLTRIICVSASAFLLSLAWKQQGTCSDYRDEHLFLIRAANFAGKISSSEAVRDEAEVEPPISAISVTVAAIALGICAIPVFLARRTSESNEKASHGGLR